MTNILLVASSTLVRMMKTKPTGKVKAAMRVARDGVA